MKRFLITVGEEFVCDTQISGNDYIQALRSSNNEDIEQDSFDKRDFFGPVILCFQDAETKEKALEKASIEYDMDIEMLSALELA